MEVRNDNVIDDPLHYWKAVLNPVSEYDQSDLHVCTGCFGEGVGGVRGVGAMGT